MDGNGIMPCITYRLSHPLGATGVEDDGLEPIDSVHGSMSERSAQVNGRGCKARVFFRTTFFLTAGGEQVTDHEDQKELEVIHEWCYLL